MVVYTKAQHNRMMLQDVSETLLVMRKQEDTNYRKRNYLSVNELKQRAVNYQCREKMAIWCYQVADFCDFSKETVIISMSYFDRYLGSDEGHYALYSTRDFQLVAMCCLQLAVKLHEPKKIDSDTLAELSRGAYELSEFHNMELKILAALRWRLSDPTATSFLKYFLQLLPKHLPSSAVEYIQYIATFQIEQGVKDYSLVPIESYKIAYAAMLNAIDLVRSPCLSLKHLTSFHREVSTVSGLIHDDTDIVDVRKHLMPMVENMEDSKNVSIPSSESTMKSYENEINNENSPVCVSKQ